MLLDYKFSGRVIFFIFRKGLAKRTALVLWGWTGDGGRGGGGGYITSLLQRKGFEGKFRYLRTNFKAKQKGSKLRVRVRKTSAK